MDDAADAPDTLTPPTRPDTLREVDWVGVAPWLELLDTPRRTLGHGFLLGAIGAVLLGGVPTDRPPTLSVEPELALAAWKGVVSPVVAVRNVFVAPKAPIAAGASLRSGWLG